MSILALILLLATKDPYPHACIDCHKAESRISVILQKPAPPALLAKFKGIKLTGKHPTVAFAFKDIPAKCKTCHTSTSKTAPPFSRVMHVVHAADIQCTACHKMNPATGEVAVPSGAE